jgi:hypothetical protein
MKKASGTDAFLFAARLIFASIFKFIPIPSNVVAISHDGALTFQNSAFAYKQLTCKALALCGRDDLRINIAQ